MTNTLALALILFSVLAMGLIVALGGLWKRWRLRRRRVESKIIVYANLIHRHGLNSEKVQAYLEANRDDEIFLRRARMFNKLKAIATEEWAQMKADS